MRTSFSALEIFEKCPKKYEFQVVERIRTPKTKEMVFGSALHSCLKYLFKNAPLFPSLDELTEYFSALWKDVSLKIKFKQEKEKEILFQQGKNILEEFYNKNIPAFSGKIIALETRFEAKISALDRQKEPHILAGIIDRIDKTDEGKFEIIDYKTGKTMPSSKSVSENFQLSIYALGFLEKWPELAKLEDLSFSLYFLKHSEKMSSSRTKEDVEKLKTRILKNISEIEKEYFPPIPSPLCNYCSYKNICPMWSHLYQKETPAEKEIKKLIDEYFAIKEKSDQNAERLAEIKKQVDSYLNKKGIDRVFGETGFISRNTTIKQDYDFEKLREILGKNNLLPLWDKILLPDKKKLEILMKEASPDVAQLLEQSKTKQKKTTITRAVKKSLERIKKDFVLDKT